MGIFSRKPRKTTQPDASGALEEVAPFSKLVAADNGGVLSFMLLSPETGEAIPFPAIEIVMRRSEELQSVVDTLRSVGAEEADIPLAEPVISGVVTLLGLDEGGHFSDLSANSLSRMRLTPELARTGALARLRQSVTHLQIDGGGGRFRVSYPDNPDLTASFMLIADGWLSGDSVAGDPVFAAGNRVSLHVCGSEDTEALAGLREIAATFYRDSVADPGAHGRPLTPSLLTVRDGVVVEFDGPNQG